MPVSNAGNPDSYVTIHSANPELGPQKSGLKAVNGSCNNEIYGFHPGGANVLLRDVSVRFLNESVSLALVSAFVSCQGGKILPSECQ